MQNRGTALLGAIRTGVNFVSVRWALLQLGQTKRCAIIGSGVSRTSSERNHLMVMRQFEQSAAARCSRAFSSRFMLLPSVREIVAGDAVEHCIKRYITLPTALRANWPASNGEGVIAMSLGGRQTKMGPFGGNGESAGPDCIIHFGSGRQKIWQSAKRPIGIASRRPRDGYRNARLKLLLG